MPGLFSGRALAALLAGALLVAIAGCDDSPAVPQMRPVEGGWISSWFGSRPIHPVKGPVPNGHHDGYDFAVAFGTPIHASMAGTVSFAGWRGGYGQAVILTHPNGYTTLYGHAAALKVKAGQRVTQGQVIALVGSTGLSTGPHLHYELRRRGVAIDPGDFLASAGTSYAASVRKVLSASPHQAKKATRTGQTHRVAHARKHPLT